MLELDKTRMTLQYQPNPSYRGPYFMMVGTPRNGSLPAGWRLPIQGVPPNGLLLGAEVPPSGTSALKENWGGSWVKNAPLVAELCCLM